MAVAAVGSTSTPDALARLRLCLIGTLTIEARPIDVVIKPGKTERKEGSKLKTTVSMVPSAIAAVREALHKVTTGTYIGVIFSKSDEDNNCHRAMQAILSVVIARLERQPVDRRASPLPLLKAVAHDLERSLRQALGALGLEDEKLARMASALVMDGAADRCCQKAAPMGNAPALTLSELEVSTNPIAMDAAQQIASQLDKVDKVSSLLSSVSGLVLAAFAVEEYKYRQSLGDAKTPQFIIEAIEVEVRRHFHVWEPCSPWADAQDREEAKEAQGRGCACLESFPGSHDAVDRCGRASGGRCACQAHEKGEGRGGRGCCRENARRCARSLSIGPFSDSRTGRRALTTAASEFKDKLTWRAADHLSCRLAGHKLDDLLSAKVTVAWIKDMLKDSQVRGHGSSKLDQTDKLALVHWVWQELAAAKATAGEV
jgi:hypothetical protein